MILPPISERTGLIKYTTVIVLGLIIAVVLEEISRKGQNEHLQVFS